MFNNSDVLREIPLTACFLSFNANKHNFERILKTNLIISSSSFCHCLNLVYTKKYLQNIAFSLISVIRIIGIIKKLALASIVSWLLN